MFDPVDTNDLGEFLISRRAKLSVQQADLPDFGGRRRVPGLRREEVALLARMSAEYYKRLERGNAKGVSDAVIDGVSRALQLDAAEHAHLYHLVRAASAGTHPRRGRPTHKLSLSPGMRQTIDAMSTVPVFIQNGRLDAVATNRLGRALFSVMFEDPRAPVNAARLVFLDLRALDFYQDWEANTRQMVAILRAEAGRSPTTASSAIWSANCRPAVTCSASFGDHKMYASTAPASRASTTRSSVTSTSRSGHGSLLRPWPPDAGLLGRTQLPFPRRPATARELG
jgi:transcriptional regulator with XRE-family HTH domain